MARFYRSLVASLPHAHLPLTHVVFSSSQRVRQQGENVRGAKRRGCDRSAPLGILLHEQLFFCDSLLSSLNSATVFNASFASSQGSHGGSDLAVAVALVSSLTGIPVRADTAFVGEVGLAGEVSSVQRIERGQRLGELIKTLFYTTRHAPP